METIDQLGRESKRPGIPSIETRQLADFLAETDKTFFAYAELSAIICRNVQNDARGYLLAARRIVLREKGFVFRPVRNQGIRRLEKREVPVAVDDRFSHVRRTHKQTLRELGTVDVCELPQPERAGYVAKAALAAMTVHTHGSEQMKRLQSAVNAQKQLDLSATLEAFKV